MADAQATDEAALADAQEEAASIWECTAVPDVDGLPSDEELFRGYAEGVLYGNDAATFGTFAGDQLEGDLKLAYDALVPELKKIASGERASAAISVGDSFADETTEYKADVAADLDGTDLSSEEGRQQFVGAILDAVLSDLPYDLYWFDKVAGLNIAVVRMGELTNVTFHFYVSAVYQDGDNLTVNTELTGAASETVDKAQAVVNQVKAENTTDYDILKAYKNWICDNVTYNHDAAASNGSGGFQENSDPWQVIYVFDGDTSTNVVCEGYSKAFQYLCDLTDWSGSVECYSVTGTLSYTGGSGPHMWNIVKLDGASYLVDVTNCDTETGTEDNSLFLVGGAPNADGSYTFAGCTFTYDDDTHALWDSTGVLTLSTSSYTPASDGFTQADLLAGIAAGAESYRYEIPESLILESDCTIDASYVYEDEQGNKYPAGWCVYVPKGVTLTVPAGVTLTVKGALGLNGGCVVVEEGGKLVIGSSETWGNIYLWGGSLSIADKAAPTITSGLVIVQIGSGYVLNATVPKENLHAQAYISSEAELRDVLNTTEFSCRDIYVQSSFDITGDLTLEAGDNLCLNNDPVVTVQEGVTLTIKADATLLVYQGSSLVNNGTITVDTDGSLTGNGEFQNNGTLNGKHTIAAAERETMTQQELMAAIESSDGSYSLQADVTIESDCTLPEGFTVWVQSSGSLTVAAGATLTVDGQLSTTNGTITVDGTLVNNGNVTLDSSGSRGSIAVSGTLENNAWVDIESGTLTFSGTYLTNLDGDGDSAGKVVWDRIHADIDGIDKIGKDNIYITVVAKTEDELRTAMDATLGEGFAEYSVGTNEDITLTKDLTIPQGIHLSVGVSWLSDGAQYQYGLTVPQGVTLTIQGSIYVGERHYLHINEGATLDNQGYLNIGGQMVNEGTVTGSGTIEGEGEFIGVAAMDSLADRFAAAAVSGENVELTTSVRLDANLDVNMSGNAELHILENGSIVVPYGYTLTITDPVVLEGGLIKVERGGILQVNGDLTIHSGMVYIASGGILNQGDGTTLPDGIVYGGEMTPYLTCRWLKNDGSGWYEDLDEELTQADGIGALMTWYAIFYLNTWDEDTLSWCAEPVVPGEDYYFAVDTISELGEAAEGGQENSEYFVRASSRNTIEETKIDLDANGFSIPFTIYQMDLGFFTSQYPSFDNCIIDPFELEAGQTNEFYLAAVPDGVTATITSQVISPDFTTLYDGEILNVEEVADSSRPTWRYTVNPEFVDYLQCNPESFRISVDARFTVTQTGEEYDCHREVYVEPPYTTLEPEAILKIGGDTYRFFENGIILREYQSNDGDYVQEKSQLPDGVSYDLESNTLTLDGAAVDALYLDNNLPTADLTIELLGDSTISSTGDYALSINGEINVTIEGEGTLTLNAGLGNCLYVEENSCVVFESGTINANFGRSELHGDVDWNGTVLNGLGSEVFAYGNFTMAGGEINLTGDQYRDTNGETVDSPAKLEFGRSGIIEGGSITIENGTLSNYGELILDGCIITVENDSNHDGLVGVENFSTMGVWGGTLSISVVGGYGIWNDYYFDQSGGTVNVSGDGAVALGTVGTFNLTGGEMNLSGYDGLVQEADPEVADDCNLSTSIYGGKLTIIAEDRGIVTVNGSVTIEGDTDSEGEYVTPEITIDAGGAAVYSLSDSLDNTNFYTENGKELVFRTEDGQYLTLTSTETDDGYLHSVENDGAVSVIIRGFTTLDAFIEGMEEAAAKYEAYVLTESLVLTEDLTLIYHVEIEDGVTLTVAEGAELTIPDTVQLAARIGGTLIVDGEITNKGRLANTGGTIHINGTYNSVGEYADVYRGLRVGNVYPEVYPSTITGIPTDQISLGITTDDFDMSTLASLSQEYRWVDIDFEGDYTFTESVTIPENVHIYGTDNIAIAEGVNVQLDGSLQANFDLIVDAYSSLVNNGELYLCGSTLRIYGDFQQNGVMELEECITREEVNGELVVVSAEPSCIEVYGTFNNTSATYLDHGTVMMVTGVLNNKAPFYVGGERTDGAGYGWAGTLNSAGVMNNNNSLTVCADGRMFVDGVVNNKDTIYVGSREVGGNESGWIGLLTVPGDPGKLHNSGRLIIRTDGAVSVNGELDNQDCGRVEVLGSMEVSGSMSNNGAYDMYGYLTVYQGGTFTNGCTGDANVYGELMLAGTLDNSGYVQLHDAAELSANCGTIINSGTIRCSNRDGKADWEAWAEQNLQNSAGVILVEYFEDGTTIVPWPGSKSELTLFYEGSSEECIRNVIQKAADEGYRDYLIRLNGDLTLSDSDLAIASNGTLVVMKGSTLTVNSAILNDGSLRIYGSLVISETGTVGETGYAYNAGMLLADEGGKITVGGELENAGSIVIGETGSCATSGYGYVHNVLDSDTIGTITGTIDGELRLTTTVTDEEQLRSAIERFKADGYTGCGIQIVAEELVISSDLYIPAKVNVQAYALDAQGNPVSGMTVIIGEGTVVTCDGILNIARDATLQVNGKLRAENGCVQITDGANLVIGSDDAAAQVIVDPAAALVIADGYYTLHIGSEIIAVWDGSGCGSITGATSDVTLEMVFDEAAGLDGFRAMCDEMTSCEYAAARVIFRVDYGTPENLYVPENVEMIVTNNANVTVNDLENHGSVSIDAGSTLRVAGELIGNEPTGDGEFIGSDVMTQAEFEEELANADEAYELQCRVELTRDLAIPRGKYVDIISGELIVESGATLTVEGFVNVSNSGKLSVLPGGCLNNQGRIEVHALPNEGCVNVEGDYTCGDEAVFGVDWFMGSPYAISGNVPKSAQFLISVFPYYGEQLYAMIETCGEGGYAGAEVCVSDMTLAQDLTIPQNVTVNVTPIANGMYNTEGWLDITGNVTVNGRLQVLAGAQLKNSGTLTLNKGSFLDIKGTYEGNAPANNGGTIIPGAEAVAVSVQDDVTTWDIHEAESCVLTVSVSSALENYETLQRVTWTSSNKNIVDPANIVDNQNGTYTVTFGSAVGNVKLTATTIDGSKKTASITLTTYYLDTANRITATVDVPTIGLQPGQQAEMHVSGSEELNPDDLVFTSSNDEIAMVKDGIITGGTKTGTARITAAIKDDPLKRSVTVSVKVIPAQIECLDLVWVIDGQEEKNLDLEVDGNAARTYILKPNPVYLEDVNGSDLTKTSFKWTSSDTKLAAVTANADGTATVTIKAGADGVCNITAVSSDLNKASAVAPIAVKDYSPRLGASSITLNPKLIAGTEVALVESYGNAIQSVAISDDRLDVNYDSGILTLSKKDGVDAISNCTINAVLTVETKLDDIARSYEYSLKVTVKNTVPSVTVKQTGKVDLFYTDSTASLSVTAKNAVVTDLALKNADEQDFALTYDQETGICTIGFSETYKENHSAKPVTKVTLLVYLEGYAVPVEKTVTIGTTTSKISLGTNPTSSTVNTDPAYGTSVSFCIYNKTTKATEVFDTVMVNGVEVTPETDGRINVELAEAVKQTLTIEASNDDWMQSVTLKHTVNVTSAVPTVKLGASTLKLSTVFPMQSVATSVSLNQSNLAISGFGEFTTTAKEGTAAYDEAQKLNVYYDDAEAKIVASFANAEEMPKTGTYTFTSTPEINGKPLTKSVTIRVTVNTAVPTVKLSVSTLKLNNLLAGEETATANVTMTNSTGLDLQLTGFAEVDGSVADLEFNPETGELSVKLKGDTAIGKYVYELYPVIADAAGNEVTMEKAVKLTVNVHDAKITVSQSASGKLDAIDPSSAIVYTVSKINNAIGTIDEVELAGVDGDKFQVELGKNAAGKQTITLKMKPGEVYNTKTTYKVTLKYTIFGQEVESSVLSVKVTQSTPKLTATTVQYYQSQQDIPTYTTLALTTPASAEIGSISVNQTKTSKELLEALSDVSTAVDLYTEDFRTFEIGIRVKNPGCLVAGKSYNLYLDVTPAGCAENVAPTAVRVTVKVAK